MGFIDSLKEAVKKSAPSLVLSEGEDVRVMKAASKILAEGLSKKVYLVGEKQTIEEVAGANEVNLEGLEIIDPETSDLLEGFADRLLELRPKDYTDRFGALEEAAHPLAFGALMHECGMADIHISGAVETSADVIRTFYHIIKGNRKEGIATSFFIMESPDLSFGENGVTFFADCAVNIDPSPRQVARIALQVGNVASKVYGITPRVALLSYSTKGSGSGEPVEATLEAEKELQKLNPSFTFEAEVQADTALIPRVSELKAPGNSLDGEANVLIFPDLQSGNIGYKLVERYGKAKAYGPIMIGLGKSASDLSRGCEAEDIVGTFIAAAYFHLKKPINLGPS